MRFHRRIMEIDTGYLQQWQGIRKIQWTHLRYYNIFQGIRQECPMSALIKIKMHYEDDVGMQGLGFLLRWHLPKSERLHSSQVMLWVLETLYWSDISFIDRWRQYRLNK